MKRIIFPNSTYDQNKYCMLLTVTLLVARTKFVVVLKPVSYTHLTLPTKLEV